MANDLKAEAILVFTRHGRMAQYNWLDRPRYSQIYALCENKDVAEELALTWGVAPFVIAFNRENPEQTIELALKTTGRTGRLHEGNTVVIISSILPANKSSMRCRCGWYSCGAVKKSSFDACVARLTNVTTHSGTSREKTPAHRW